MKSSDLKICLFPMNIKWGDKQANLDCLKEAAARVHPETDLLILPETFSTGFPVGMDKEEVRPLAERNTGPTVDFLKELAAKTFEDKRHLFTMAGENKVFSRGYGRLKIRYRGWNLAMVICYDIRFPVWCRNVHNEYDALIAVANWPEVRVNAWEALLAARAIENEAYVCAVDCKGADPKGYDYNGSSAVYDFKGRDVSVRFEPDGLVYATLSRDRLDSFREKFPAWADADPFKLI